MPAIGSSLLPCLATMYVALASASGVLQRSFARFERRAAVELEPEPVAEPESHWPSVDVVLPCFNEDPTQLRACLESILGQRYKGALRLWVVDDGSSNWSALQPVYDELAADAHCELIRLRDNRGKRLAQDAAVRRSQAAIVLNIDSDTAVSPDALRTIVRLVRDRQVAMATGNLRPSNRGANRLTRLMEVRYRLLFEVERGAQSRFDSVLCRSGSFSAYRRSAVCEVWSKGTVASAATACRSQTVGMRTRRRRLGPVPQSAFAGFRFPPEVIVLAVRWYLRFGLSYRDLEELLTERGVEVDHVTVYRWVLRFTPLLAEAARPCRHAVGDRWSVDETYVRVAGQWRYVYRAIDQFGQVIDVFIATRRDATAARRFFERAIGTTKVRPAEITTDRAPVYPAVLEELLPFTWHRTDQYANNRVEADHGRLKSRLRPMRGLKQDRSARVIIGGHAFVQNVRRGHYELAAEEPASRRLAVAFDELAMAI